MSIEDTIAQERFRRTTGTALTFQSIDGVGNKTAQKVTNVRGIDAPRDAADYSANRLADEAGISESRARTVIQGAGGRPDVDERRTTGSVSAGGLADAMDDRTRQAAEVVEQRREVFGDVVEAATGVPDRRSRRRGDFGPLEDEDPQRVRELGRAADTFRRATDDPIDPTEEPRRFGFNGEEARERAGRLSTAASEFLEQEEDLTFDEARSEIRGQQPDLETVEQVVGSQRGPADIFRGPTTPTDIGRTETGRFDRPDTDPAVDPQPIARDKSTGRFGLDPFDIGASLGGLGGTDEEFGGGVENRQQFDLPDQTVATARTQLNEEVFGEGRDELDDLRQRMTVGEPVELDRDEYQTVRRVVSDRRRDAEDRAERMDRNIFGDTSEQADRARRAEQGLINNPPTFVGDGR